MTPQTHRRRGKPDDGGQATIEFLTLTPWLLIAGIAAFQAYITVVAIERVDNAARTGARVESMGRDGGQAAAEALPGWLNSQRPAEISVNTVDDTAHARISAKVPILYGLPYHYTVTRTVEMPVG
ncbi:MAG: hypothetical protein GEV03_11020 [Streptosporangiales bacterium]|nr:hypothetical protein [Streptosporangiales bacterium]